MSKIVWDQVGERLYETGVKNGVLYPFISGAYTTGVPWNGLISVTEKPSGAESNPLYADNIKYLNLISREDFGASVEAFTYPPEFEQCDGSAEIEDGVSIGQQERVPFGMCYKTSIGNDTDGIDHGYKLHIIYGAIASPSEKGYSTVNDTPDAITLSWEITTTPVEVTGFKPTACLTINSTKTTAQKLAALEEILYGRNASAVGDSPAVTALEPRLPLPDEIATLMAA